LLNKAAKVNRHEFHELTQRKDFLTTDGTDKHGFLQETGATGGGTGVSPGHRAIELAFVMDFIFLP
jgi:hypothetical protein